MRIRFVPDGAGVVGAEWKPEPCWEGFRGIIHGGIVASVLDEAMSKAVAIQCEALTAELRVRFRREIAPGATFLVRGWIRRRTKRLIETEATLTSTGGAEHAHAWAVFLALSKTREA
ncbi:MAG: PaaI family thioesterase [Bryobacteraceae bacterium]